MIVANEIRLKYNLVEPHIIKVKEQVDSILFNYCQKNNFAYASRKKDLDSLSEKFETGRFNSWDEIDDLVAGTIIISNLNKEPEVIEFLQSQFKDLQIKNKKTFPLDPENFRFDATRVYCKLKTVQQGLESIFDKYTIEIQVRTALEHAWSVATHPLTYKSNVIDWETSRLVAQLKANIEQLDMLIVGASDIKKHIVSRGWTGVDFKKQIISKTVALIEQGIIPLEHKPKDLSRYSENILKIFENISDLRGRYKKKNFKDLLDQYENSLKSLKNKMPMSISLYQIVLGIFIEEGRLSDDAKIHFLITTEMKQIFPKSNGIKKVINFA
jgi:ppGpp synthetase/RelA/SpoT-type nucleotidyltranferase